MVHIIYSGLMILVIAMFNEASTRVNASILTAYQNEVPSHFHEC